MRSSKVFVSPCLQLASLTLTDYDAAAVFRASDYSCCRYEKERIGDWRLNPTCIEMILSQSRGPQQGSVSHTLTDVHPNVIQTKQRTQPVTEFETSISHKAEYETGIHTCFLSRSVASSQAGLGFWFRSSR